MSPRLRKTKQNELDNRLDINDHNTIRNLQIFKYTKRSGSIHGVGLNPLYVIHILIKRWQMTMFKIINRSRSAYFTMDATGNIAKELLLSYGTKSAHFFLYQCMIIPEDKCGIPVFR